MQDYIIEWYINATADSPEDAARQSLAIQRDPSSLATVFSVFESDENGHKGTHTEVDIESLNDPEAPTFLLVRGNPVDGFAYEGPYASHAAAVWGREGDGTDWWVATLDPTPKP